MDCGGKRSATPLSSAQPGWNFTMRPVHVSEKSHFRTAKKLAKSCTGREIPETTRKTQFDAMNHKSNGKYRLKCANILMTAGLSPWPPIVDLPLFFPADQPRAAHGLDANYGKSAICLLMTEYLSPK